MSTRLLFPIFVAALVVLSACKSEKSRLEDLYAASTGAGSRGTVANDLRKQWAEGKVTMVEAVAMAHTKLDSPGDGASVVFAGAVLDVVGMIEPEIDSTTTEMFWIQVGTLAGKAAGVAFSAGDVPLARSMVLSGSERWQNDAYWQRHPTHDAAASVVLHRSGETKEALARLRERPDMASEVQEAYDLIERDWRRANGG
jgi:hypothetical protein